MLSKLVSAIFALSCISVISAFPFDHGHGGHGHPPGGPPHGPPGGSGGGFNWQDTKHVIAFGDSYTYVQGTLGYVNSTFIGSMLDLAFTPEELLSDQIVQNQTGTAEGGPNWVEYLTGCGLEPGLTYPITCERQLWDFAFGGSDIEQTTYTPLHHNWTVPLVNQTSQFRTYAQPTLSHIINPNRSLIIFWIGINDISDSAKYAIHNNISIDFPSFYNTIIDAQFAAVQSVHAAGYDNFLFLNLPPLNLVPGSAINPTLEQIAWWDNILAAHITAFNSNNTNANAMLFDANTFLNNVVAHAQDYGIKNATGYCTSYNQPNVDTDPESYGCLPLYEYFWFNNGHLASHVHEILAGEVARFLEGESGNRRGGWW